MRNPEQMNRWQMFKLFGGEGWLIALAWTPVMLVAGVTGHLKAGIVAYLVLVICSVVGYSVWGRRDAKHRRFN
jgi:hypothetical protein